MQCMHTQLAKAVTSELSDTTIVSAMAGSAVKLLRGPVSGGTNCRVDELSA